jgi:hypothetical protein
LKHVFLGRSKAFLQPTNGLLPNFQPLKMNLKYVLALFLTPVFAIIPTTQGSSPTDLDACQSVGPGCNYDWSTWDPISGYQLCVCSSNPLNEPSALPPQSIPLKFATKPKLTTPQLPRLVLHRRQLHRYRIPSLRRIRHLLRPARYLGQEDKLDGIGLNLQ